MAELTSQRYEVKDMAEAIELYYAKGWTDGLPVVPPTENSIWAMLESAGLKPEDEIAFIENRQVSVTAEKVAINTVMAGCRPEYMPVVTAAIEAIGDAQWGYHGPATSTGGSAVFMVVNGPLARELDINCGDNLFGPGWRANAAIGRAVRLTMRNVIGTIPGRLDRSTLGHGGKYSYCIAENEAESPWPALHVERGFRPEQSTVTVFAALAPHQVYNQLSNTPEGILTTMCAFMRISAGVRGQPQYALIIAGEHMAVIGQAGWSKDDIRQFCFEHSKTSRAELKRINIMPGAVAPGDETRMHDLVETPQDFLVVAAGSRAGAFSAFIPGWGGKRSSQSVTKEIRRP
ncbi:MAG: hypothetical protein FJZ47_18670 [Candidatus Tectomicrobia bacterium]|uniref:Thioredoxin n=1 Tax=Tectimicrobiota bacterium TaxID=2528274 RepID=A0A937W5Z5_UNCTE|nr:hypothetical protein [Candidatus Tectomicrobia bacterium]